MNLKKLIFAASLIVVFVGCSRVMYDQPRKKSKGPFETVWIYNSIFFDQIEVTTADWRYYLDCIEKKYGKNSAQYSKALPDTTVWRDELGKNEAMVKYYYRDINFATYPIVGVSYEQAIDYCKWKTDTVSKVYDKIRNKKILPKKVVFRLPTKEEWRTAASASLSAQTEPYGYENLFNNNNICKVVCKEYTTLLKTDIEDPKTCSVYQGGPNIFNLYNMTGNVAEMCDEKGVALGGSWKDPLSECKITSEQKYTKPSNWLGFRCVCEVSE